MLFPQKIYFERFLIFRRFLFRRRIRFFLHFARIFVQKTHTTKNLKKKKRKKGKEKKRDGINAENGKK